MMPRKYTRFFLNFGENLKCIMNVHPLQPSTAERLDSFKTSSALCLKCTMKSCLPHGRAASVRKQEQGRSYPKLENT